MACQKKIPADNETMSTPESNTNDCDQVREATVKVAAMRHARLWLMILLAALGLPPGLGARPVSTATPSAPANLRVDDVSAPVGTEAVPYFGWLDNDANANEIQTAYQILVATNAADLAANFGDVWDSGQVAGSSENHVVYAGAPLTADTQYYWKVRTWNREGNAGPYSTNSAFEGRPARQLGLERGVVDLAQHQCLRRLHLLSQVHPAAGRDNYARDGLCVKRAKIRAVCERDAGGQRPHLRVSDVPVL